MTVKELNPHGYQTNEFQKAALEKLAKSVTRIEEACGRKFIVTSGFRTLEDQLRINPANKNSAHRTGEAVDLSDVDGSIYAFCLDNVPLLIELEIYLECRTYTNRWIHMQNRRPRSGNRIFIP